MIRKILFFLMALAILIGAVNAIDSSNWTTATVGYEEFKIPPQYENPYQSDFHMYEFDEDIDVFTIRYVNPAIMDLYGYFIEHNQAKKKSRLPAMMPSTSPHMTGMTRKTTQNCGFHPERNSTILPGGEIR